MNTFFHHALLLAGTLMAVAVLPVAAEAPDTGTASKAVTVQYVNPHDFTESRQSAGIVGFDQHNYLEKLKTYLQQQAAPMLAAGQHLSVRITDIDLAGSYEPWRAPAMTDVRIMRDIYPPRIELSFTLTGANGKTLRSGDRQLNGLGYLSGSAMGHPDHEPLRYDKSLLDRWLRQGPDNW